MRSRKVTFRLVLVLFLTCALVLSVNMAHAASTQWATNVEDYNQGTLVTGGPITNPARTDPNAALGAPNGSFYSLGFVSNDDGYLVVSFGQPICNCEGDDIVIYEVTMGRAGYPDEVADVYVIVDGVEYYAGTVTNHDAPDGRSTVAIPGGLLYIDAVKLVDNTDPAHFSDPKYENADGYDVDAVGVCTCQCIIWTTDAAEIPKISFGLGETVYIHWMADGTVDITAEFHDGTPDGSWPGQPSTGVIEYVPSLGAGHYIIRCSEESTMIGCGTFTVIPDLPLGTVLAVIACFVAFGTIRLKKRP